MHRSKVLALLALGLLSGCGGPADESGLTVRDSAGVQIVTSVEPAWTTPWRVPAEPQLTLGAKEGEPAQEFTRILQALRLGDGRIVVADQQSMEIRYFEDSGAFVRSVGGSGGGPGEFDRLEDIALLPGDSLFAYGQWKATVFDPEGEFVRSFAVEPPEIYVLMGPKGHFADGGFLMTQTAYPLRRWEGPTRIERPEQPVYRYGSTGTSLGVFGSYPGWEFTVHPDSRGRGFNRGTREFARSTAVLAHDDRVYVADNASYEIQVYHPSGSLVALYRRDREPVPVTEQDIETLRAPRLAAEERRPMMEQYFRSLPAPPETMPAFGYQILVDRADNLWVLEYERPSEAQRRRWSVFDPDGRWLGILRLPDGFDLMDAGDDWVLGRVRDELDVEYVQLYQLIKGP